MSIAGGSKIGFQRPDGWPLRFWFHGYANDASRFEASAQLFREPVGGKIVSHNFYNFAHWVRPIIIVTGMPIQVVTLPECLARVEGVADGLADEDEKRKRDRNRQEAGDAEPGGFKVLLALEQQFAERG
jgi:hypothetical protein